MFFILLMRLLRGSVRFSVKGGFPERFLNLCAYRGFNIWALAREDGVLYGSVMAHCYPQMRAIARKTGVKMRLTAKSGLPFVFFRYRRRPGIPVGCVVFAGFLAFMSGFIWNIQVSGLKTLDEKEVLDALSSLGLREGAKIDGIDTPTLRTRLLLENKDLSWASVNLEGSFAFVEVREVEKQPEKNDAPADIKAKRDGRIIEMEVYVGTPLVQKGEAVVEGDLLVSGTVQYATGATACKRAQAKIIAETQHRISETVPLRQVVIAKTGEVKTRYALKIFGVRVPLYLGSVGGDYVLERRVTPLVLDGVRLPIELGLGQYFFTAPKELAYTPEQAAEIARKKIAKREKEELGQSEIKDRREIVENNGEWVKVTIDYSCEENISVEENLLINEGK